MPILRKDWDVSMLRDSEPQGPYLTKSTAHYPAAMNAALAHAIFQSVLSARPEKAKCPRNRSSEIPSSLPRVIKRARLTAQASTPRELRDEEPTWVGGLRSPRATVMQSPVAINIGVQVRNLIDGYLDRDPRIEAALLGSIGQPAGSVSIPVEFVDALRVDIAKLLVRSCNLTMSQGCWNDFNLGVQNELCQTSLKYAFLKLWTQAISDPAGHVIDWLDTGSPAGLLEHANLEGVWPRVEDDDAILHANDLYTNFDTFENYEGVESNPAAKTAVQGYIDKGYLQVFETLDECIAALGGKPVLSRLGCITTTKFSPEGLEVIKHRIILDAKQSSVTAATSRRYRSVLPRLTDAVNDVLAMLSSKLDGEFVEQLVADVTDAFWLIPLSPEERRFFVAWFEGRYLVFQRTAQGSRGAPLTFCTVMAVVARLLQSLLLRDHLARRSHRQDARLQIYIDDPWSVARGTKSQINRLFSIILLTWELVGFPVATHKAIRGTRVKWIGMLICINLDSVSVTIPEEKVLELEVLCSGFLESNIISKRKLRTFVGKAMSIASIIYTWRPFLSQLHAALYSTEKNNAPHNCVWTKQVESSLLWFMAFFHRLKQHLVRTWMLDAFQGQGSQICIIWDASPFGFGAVLVIDDVIIEYFHDVPCPFEMELLGLRIGDSESQQALECLGGLVALRTWATYWMTNRVILSLRSDNVGALALLGRLKTSSSRNSIMAREFALDLGNACFAPRVTEHIPGFTNKCCDALSRLHDANMKCATPSLLHGARRVDLPTRERSWWRSIFPPQLRRSARGV